MYNVHSSARSPGEQMYNVHFSARSPREQMYNVQWLSRSPVERLYNVHFSARSPRRHMYIVQWPEKWLYIVQRPANLPFLGSDEVEPRPNRGQLHRTNGGWLIAAAAPNHIRWKIWNRPYVILRVSCTLAVRRAAVEVRVVAVSTIAKKLLDIVAR
jgi:hypothetical protein